MEPPLFFHHRPAGPLGKDSDIRTGAGPEVRLKGVTEMIVWSARVNAERLVRDEGGFETSWPERSQSA